MQKSFISSPNLASRVHLGSYRTLDRALPFTQIRVHGRINCTKNLPGALASSKCKMAPFPWVNGMSTPDLLASTFHPTTVRARVEAMPASGGTSDKCQISIPSPTSRGVPVFTFRERECSLLEVLFFTGHRNQLSGSRFFCFRILPEVIVPI